MTKQPQYSHSYILTAGESDAEGRMPLTLVTERVIEVATEHANALNIGYDALIKKNIGWVLSRLSIEMLRYPRINGHYTLTTWIESYNRHFSERNFVMTDAAGDILGHMRTVWVAMDFATRSVADLTSLESIPFPLDNAVCPIEKTPRIPHPGADATTEEYTFRYRDIDFDDRAARRLDIMFHNECHFGETVALRVAEGPGSCPSDICEIVKPDGTRAVSARILWRPCETR